MSKTFGSGQVAVHAVDDLTLSFEEGSFTAITGRSGSGKSTLLHLLGGLEKPEKGEVLMEKESVYALADAKRTILRRRRMGFIFQSYNLIPDLTAYQNIILPIRLDNRPVDRDFVQELVDGLGLGERLHHYPSELSGGQCQRVAIARALATKPAVVLADEPTGNLDIRSSKEVLALLHMLKKRYNQTLVMVTHDLNIAEGADRLVTLVDGRVSMDTVDMGKGGRVHEMDGAFFGPRHV